MKTRITECLDPAEFRYRLMIGQTVTIQGFNEPLRESECGLLQWDYDTDTHEVTEADLTAEKAEAKAVMAYNEQQAKGLLFLTQNYDRLREVIIKCDALEAKMDGDYQLFMDTLTSMDNIDKDACSNVRYSTNIEVDNLNQQAVIKTKNLSLTTSKIRVCGEGMSLEYNVGMQVEASNNGGQTWETVPFTTSPVLSDELTFTSQPTGDFRLRLTLIPKAIDPQAPVTGRAYVTSYAILY